MRKAERRHRWKRKKLFWLSAIDAKEKMKELVG